MDFALQMNAEAKCEMLESQLERAANENAILMRRLKSALVSAVCATLQQAATKPATPCVFTELHPSRCKWDEGRGQRCDSPL